MNLIIIIIIFAIFTYIAIKDWKTGLISVTLNFIVFGLSILYSFLNQSDIRNVLIKLAIFVLPFIILEFIYQFFFNKEKDENKFLIGGGDIILFASMSIILTGFGMMVMLFFASLSSLIIAKIVKEKKIPFAPFLEFGFLISYVFSEKLLMMVNMLIISIYSII